MASWTPAFDGETVAIVERVVAGDPRDAWRALMVAIAPHLEAWARNHRLLRRCRLAGDDDARAVMVAVLERLAADRHANLRRFVARERASEPAIADDDLVARVERYAKLDDDGDARAPVDAGEATPLRAWLLRLLDYTARDHVRERLGWRTGDAPTKRALHSDAVPLDDAPVLGARPPMTDRLTIAQLLDEVVACIATFPAEMRAALELWLDDLDDDDIARRLALPDGARARAVIRAGQARLRERFRGRSPVLFA